MASRAGGGLLSDTMDSDQRLADALAEIERLRARILELEAAAAMTRGTVGTLEAPPDDFSVTDTPPSTPR